MATDKLLAPNIDNSDSTNFPNGRIKDNTGSGDGTPVNRLLYGDIHEFFAKLMRLAKMTYNGLPESEGNGYQLVQALQALANKNDIVATLNSVAGKLQITTVKLSTLVLNEMLICKAAADYASETDITDAEAGVDFTVSVSSAYKANDYLRLIKTTAGITIVRLVNADNLNVLVTALNFLKAATNAQTITGIATNVAVTPASLLAAFTDWVNGVDSASYLATHSVNGLMSKTDKALLDSLNNPVKNVGWFSGVDPGGGTVGSDAPVSGDITVAQITSVASSTIISGTTYGGATTYRVTFANAMANNNYFVRLHVMSEGTMETDNNIWHPVFRPISTTQFDFSIQEGAPGTQSLKIHCEVVQIS